MYRDHDLKNCHATLLRDECERIGLPCPHLEAYVNERESVLESIMKECEVTREAAKRLPIVLLYGGTVYCWQREYNVKRVDESALGFIAGFRGDLQTISAVLQRKNEKLWRSIQESTRKVNGDRARRGERKKNARSTLLARFAHHLERQAIESVYKGLTEEQRAEFVYCFDGFLLPVEQSVSVSELNTWTRARFPSATWEYKEMDAGGLEEAIDLAVGESVKDVVDEEVDEGVYATEGFDMEHFKSLKTYKKKCAYWERYCVKVRFGDYWFCDLVTEESTGQVRRQYAMDRRTLDNRFGDFRTGDVTIHRKDGTFTGQPGTRIHLSDTKSFVIPGRPKFIAHWLQDENKRSCKHIRFCPSPVSFKEVKHTADHYNTFKGYPEFLFDESIEITGRDRRALEVWRDMLLNLVGGGLSREAQESTLHGVECLFAHSVFQPSKRLMLGLIIQSMEGEGKGLTLSTLESLVGREHFISTANVQDFLGNHAEGVVHKLFIVMNEISFSDTKGKENALKALVTEERWRVNPKFVTPYDVDMYAVIILTTNNKFSIYLDLANGERRWIVCNGTGKYAGRSMSASRWRKLAEAYRSKGFLRLLFEHLRSVFEANKEYDFKQFKQENSRRKAYRELALHAIPDLAFFLQDWIESKRYARTGVVVGSDACEKVKEEETFDKPECFGQVMAFCGRTLTQTFREWASEHHFEYGATRNEKQFYARLQSLNVPHERVSRGGRTYVHLCVREVYRMLYRRQFIEVDASVLSWLKAEDSGRDAGEGLAFFDEESDGDDDGEEAAGEC